MNSSSRSDKGGVADQGAPIGLITTLLLAFPILAAHLIMEQGRGSTEWVPSFTFAGFITMGLGLCFYWRRLPPGTLKTISAGIFLAAFWTYTLIMTAIPWLPQGIGSQTAQSWGIKIGHAGFALAGLFLAFAWAAQTAKGRGLTLTLTTGTVGLCALLMGANYLNHPAPQELHAKNTDHAIGHDTTASAPAPSSNHGGGHDVHWSYKGEGAPKAWGDLKADFALCKIGQEQSPIDIPRRSGTNDANFDIKWRPAQVAVVDNGHTVQFNFEPGSALLLNGHRFGLKQFHYHAPSEHTLNGVTYPLELHFVHADDKGQLAVVGLFVEKGRGNIAADSLVKMMDQGQGDLFHPATLLPKSKLVYQYLGSLTTPPCSEGVKWNVLAHPVEFSSDQIAAFLNHYDSNARPVQPLYERLIGKISQ